MAPKKALSPAKAAPSAAEYFTRGKKPTTTDRVIATKKTVTTTPSPASSCNNNSNKNNNKLTTEQKRQALKRQRRRKSQDAVVVTPDYDEEKEIDKENSSTTATTAVNYAHVDVNNDGIDATSIGEDFGPLDDYRFDDPFESPSPKRQPQRQLQPQTKPPMVTSILKLLIQPQVEPQVELQIESQTTAKIMEPLTKAPLSVSLPIRQPHSHVRVIPGIHQDEISEQERMLRQFDLTSKYGPSLNITRLERWERAFQLGLAPPADIKDMLVENAALNTPIFSGRV
ncbi:hypothetical protein EC991_010804 [Linnemannia zychae]|nr:hypothetical protein EC991_010804 [Linnemannia zychae]